MAHCSWRCLWVVGLVLSIICTIACGGGSSSTTTTPPPGSNLVLELAVLSGDGQVAMAGTSLPEPVQLRVMGGGHPVPDSPISFTADTGVKIVPNPAITGPEGQTRVLVYLPDVTNSTFKIVAKAQTGDPKTFTAGSGPRMLAMLGKPAPSAARALDDGTLVLGSVTGSNAVPGVWVLAPDGSVRANSSPASRRFVLPNSHFFPCRSRQAGRLAFHNMDGMVLFTDLDLNVLNYVDLYTSTGMAPYVSSISAVGPDGSMYVRGSDGIIALDPKGRPKWTVNNPAGPTYINRLDLTPAGNIVGMSAEKVTEFRPDGTVAGSFAPPEGDITLTSRSVAVAPNDNIVVGIRPPAQAGIELFVYSPKYELIGHIFPTWETGTRINIDFVVAGADSNGNYYLVASQDFILRIDATGRVTKRIEDHDFHVGWGMVADVPRDRMLVGHYGSNKYTIVNNLQLGADWTPNALQPSVGPDPATGEFYVTSIDNSPFSPMRIDVYDSSFSFLRTMSFSQFSKPRQTVIDSVGNKYILDESTRSIHKLDAFDTYSGSIPLGTMWHSSMTIALAPDNALLVNACDSSSSFCDMTKMKPDGTSVWTAVVDKAPFAVDNDGSIYLDHFGVIKKLDSTGQRVADFTQYRFGGIGPLTIMNDKLYALGADRVYIIQLR